MPAGVELLHNPRWAQGQATSLRVALDRCGRQGHLRAVVGLGDQPVLTAAAWRAVARRTGGPIVVATYGGRRRNPVRLAAAIWPLLPATATRAPGR